VEANPVQRVRPVSDYIEDLRRWTTEVLSRPSDQLRGMPPCPFAADAWEAGLVAVGLCDGLDDVTDALDFYPASRRDVFICVLPDVEGLTSEELARYVEDKNEGLVAEDMWLMAYHPDDDPNEYGLEYLDADWEPIVEEDYAMVFVQQLSKLTAASYNLEKQGYYDECPWKTYRDLVHRRTEKAIQHGKFRPDDI
jgi:hypothetical protein